MNVQDIKTTDEIQIRTLIDQRARALYQKDAQGALSCLTADFIAFSLAPPLISAMTDAKAYEAWFATWRSPIGTEIRDLRVAVSGDLGVSHSLNLMTGTSADGHEVKLWYRQTLSFRKVDGVWKIAHEHNSVPFYMDGSFRAAIDLTP
ncbi:MAG TPA: nuclear transport factor 2 family protein [Bradyrhizobium sp.]